MGRKNSRGLELTFHKPSKRWCKVVNAKRHYFGYGAGVSDRKRYREAVTECRKWQIERNAENERAQEVTANRELGSLMTKAWETIDEQLDAKGRFLLGQLFKTLAHFDAVTIQDDEARSVRR